MKGGKSSGATRKADTKLSVKKTAAKGKVAKDPNKPKRPASAFFVFMEDFRKQFKEDHPDNKSVATVGKVGGAKWKSMSDSEKAHFQAKADKRKKEYENNLDTYNKKLAGGGNDDDDEDSDKSKSEVNDEADEDESDDEEDDD
ncbi:high mobility group B protein 3 [Lactuca sativa]|uniref:HMG box domain-containing protein n=1 Tax=Lactuca sativa TaxID=4236 RepID=A0A9R1VSE6_LACSA|nr:high mobility group B protein 3 [Lactuca sativa]KAJ0210629.1 hypothetical protein LSAT_V11C400223040 [Lactuca sativa]